MCAVPHRLEQGVGETQGHQVLHRLLAEVMVDAEDRAFRKHRPDVVVDGVGACAIVADRLFNDDARAGSLQPLGAEPARNRAEEVGAGGEIEGADAFVRPERIPKIGPAGVVHGVGSDVVEAGEEPIERLARAVVDRLEFHQRVLHAGAEDVAVEAPARHADDPGRVGELSAPLAMEQRRIELAIGEIARPAEHDQIERINLDDARSHFASQPECSLLSFYATPSSAPREADRLDRTRRVPKGGGSRQLA